MIWPTIAGCGVAGYVAIQWAAAGGLVGLAGSVGAAVLLLALSTAAAVPLAALVARSARPRPLTRDVAIYAGVLSLGFGAFLGVIVHLLDVGAFG